eukprot:Tbor_TRINITY_DN5102_c1_g4::TRINITY_DN5102_c1_g4_i1::g.26334::m.26334/K00586/DPH5; diphthine methyl ester synthase
MFIIIGIGLGDEKDITVKGLEAVKAADIVFLEAYTSYLINSNSDLLSEYYGKPITVADREMVESGVILNDAKEKTVALLVVGDVFGATTHSDLIVRCDEAKIPVRVIHNASIISAVGCCGLQLYRFGQVLSLCFWTETWRPDSWYERLLSNKKAGVHTLLLLDIKVKEVSDENLARGRKIFEPPRYMSITQALDQLAEVEKNRKGGAINDDTIYVGMSRIGSKTQHIAAGTRKDLEAIDFGEPLHSLIVAGDIHLCESEHLNLYAANKHTFINLMAKK